MDALRGTLKRHSRSLDPDGSTERGVPTDHEIQASPIARRAWIQSERSSATALSFAPPKLLLLALQRRTRL